MSASIIFAILISIMVLGYVESTSNSLYHFKCGQQVFMCPGLNKTTTCAENSNPTYFSISDPECQGLINQILQKKDFDDIICPKGARSKGQELSHFTEYGCNTLTGVKYDDYDDTDKCSCSAGFCGMKTCGGGATGGDPHFKTHDGTVYEFHGECDLVMARSKKLASGLDIDIHARTTDMDGWSLVSNAVVRIGEEIFEVQNDGTHFLNGVPDLEFPIHISNTYEITKSIENLENDSTDPEEKYRTWYTIQLENHHKIYVMRYTNMITIRVDAELQDTTGMLGSPIYKQGMVGRDGQTLYVDANEMGLEWQVKDHEPMLFREIRSPQFPEPCKVPDAEARRLRLSQGNVEEANEACANVIEVMRPSCIHDVLMTGNKYAAHTYTGWQ